MRYSIYLFLSFFLSASSSFLANPSDIVKLYRIDEALRSIDSPKTKKELARSLLSARSLKRSEYVNDEDDLNNCLLIVAELCDLIATTNIDCKKGTTNIDLSCKTQHDFSSKNWAIELLLDDIILHTSTLTEGGISSTKSHTTNSDSISSSSSSNSNDILKTKAQKLWEVYLAKYRNNRHIRVRIHRESSLPSSSRRVRVHREGNGGNG